MKTSHDRIDTVVIGGSAGGFSTLKTLLAELPPSLPAVVLVTLHRGPTEVATLATLLARYSSLPTIDPEEGETLREGTVIFAPLDRHMLIGDGHVHLRRGPAENGFRPAIDPLFRSAAVYRPTRTVGVVLSGRLDDGASGLRAIWRVGGRALVQDPTDALAGEMPSAARRAVPDAQVGTASELAAMIAAMVGEKADRPAAAPQDIRTELTISALEASTMEMTESLGELSPYNCPDCNGVLWEIKDGELVRYRCHTGHAYSEDTLVESQLEALERSLEDSLRAQRGHASLLRRMAERSPSTKNRERLLARAEGYEEDSRLVEQALRRRAARQ
ncbi:chemotaxis protein CheB [Parvularcula maris]|uniref:protein-glutamate methylesterase n=1 Tax=Parvularcula maris TaxID=2965077 RepID=A0A9X2RIC1_9PROT|nr:chemotaxis protein CheB [Parvularcula maris]MCQ8185880.1 chemotaxis protein CheB [Parvularcula maris]